MIGQELAEVIIDDFMWLCTKRELALLDSVFWSPDTDQFIIAVKKPFNPKQPKMYPSMALILESACFFRRCQHGGIFVKLIDGQNFEEIGDLPPSEHRRRDYEQRLEALS